jgi:transposase
MGQKSGSVKEPAKQVVKEIRRVTRRQFSAEQKIRIVLTGLRGEDSIAELCRREGIVENLYYRWSKEFLEAGKKRLAGDTARAATSDEVKDLRREASAATSSRIAGRLCWSGSTRKIRPRRPISSAMSAPRFPSLQMAAGPTHSRSARMSGFRTVRP